MCVKDFISFIKEGMSKVLLTTSSKRIQKPAITCFATTSCPLCGQEAFALLSAILTESLDINLIAFLLFRYKPGWFSGFHTLYFRIWKRKALRICISHSIRFFGKWYYFSYILCYGCFLYCHNLILNSVIPLKCSYLILQQNWSTQILSFWYFIVCVFSWY